MVRPIKSECCIRLKRTPTGRTSFKRPGYVLTADRESKLSTLKGILKNENQYQRNANLECQI